MNKPNKKDVSLLDIGLLVLVFLVFDVVLMLYSSLPKEMFVTWDLVSGQPITYVREIGIFILPAISLILFIGFSLATLLTKNLVRKKQLHVIKILTTLLLLFFYCISVVKNISYPNLPLGYALGLLFFLLSLATSLVMVLRIQTPLDLKNTSLPSKNLLPLVEGLVIVIIGVVILNTLFWQDWLKTIGLISFITTLGYSFFFIYYALTLRHTQQQSIASLLIPPPSPSLPSTPVAPKEEETNTPIVLPSPVPTIQPTLVTETSQRSPLKSKNLDSMTPPKVRKSPRKPRNKKIPLPPPQPDQSLNT